MLKYKEQRLEELECVLQDISEYETTRTKARRLVVDVAENAEWDEEQDKKRQTGMGLSEKSGINDRT